MGYKREIDLWDLWWALLLSPHLLGSVRWNVWLMIHMSCVGREMVGRNGVRLLATLDRWYLADVKDCDIFLSTQIQPRCTLCITVLGCKINSYAVSEFTEGLCDFQDTSLTCTNEQKVEAIMADLFIFCEIPWYVVCIVGREIKLIRTLACLTMPQDHTWYLRLGRIWRATTLSFDIY